MKTFINSCQIFQEMLSVLRLFFFDKMQSHSHSSSQTHLSPVVLASHQMCPFYYKTRKIMSHLELSFIHQTHLHCTNAQYFSIKRNAPHLVNSSICPYMEVSQLGSVELTVFAYHHIHLILIKEGNALNEERNVCRNGTV